MAHYVVEVNGKQIGGSYSSSNSARKKATDVWETYGEEAHVIRVGGGKNMAKSRAKKARRRRHKAAGKKHCNICKRSHKSPAWCRLQRMKRRGK